jgi:putative oxidoreductase
MDHSSGKEASMKTSERAKWAAVPLRLVMGIIFAVAGYMKLVGIAATIEYFAKQGFPVPVATAWFITLLELCGGIALILGLLVRYLGLIYTIEFIVAAFWVKLPTQGYAAARLDLMLLAGAVALYFLGAGRWSIDSVWLEKEKRQ